ncbi:MAG: hypothetical protein C4519_25050 [Desulfobacteraceae bacterium]|nr:MAG: hypothetical protein C4519_25050 [Desulfobacteraceae bacterium]
MKKQGLLFQYPALRPEWPYMRKAHLDRAKRRREIGGSWSRAHLSRRNRLILLLLLRKTDLKEFGPKKVQ